MTRYFAVASLSLWILPLTAVEEGGVAYGGVAEAAGAARSQSDPGELYLAAYRLSRESELLAERQSYRTALRKGQEAERVLATLVRDHPNWKTNLVGTRRRLLAENMANYRKLLRESGKDEGEKGNMTAGNRTREELQLELPQEPARLLWG